MSDFTEYVRHYPLTYTAVFPDGEHIYFARNPFKSLTQKRSREIVKEFGGNVRDYLINMIGKKLNKGDYRKGRQIVTVFEKFNSAFDCDDSVTAIYELVYEYTEEGWKYIFTKPCYRKTARVP
jgi:hypothetical protein